MTAARFRRLALLAAIVAACDGTAVAQSQPMQTGAELYESRCGGCHALAAHRIGPRHEDLAGRRAGSLADYDYSPALRASRVVWDAETLDRWLTDPEAVIPGQRMAYRLSSPDERVAVIRYLLTR